MNRTKVIATLTACLTTSAVEARVFERTDQCEERYGMPKSTTSSDILTDATYVKNGVIVQVKFRDKRAVSVTYQKEINLNKSTENRAFKPEDVEKLLEANSWNRTWGKPIKSPFGPTRWTTTDGAITAELSGNLILKIEDAEEPARRKKDEENRLNSGGRSLDGF